MAILPINSTTFENAVSKRLHFQRLSGVKKNAGTPMRRATASTSAFPQRAGKIQRSLAQMISIGKTGLVPGFLFSLHGSRRIAVSRS